MQLSKCLSEKIAQNALILSTAWHVVCIIIVYKLNEKGFKMFEVKRTSAIKYQGTTYHHTETVYRNETLNNCIDWINSVIERNNYEVNISTDLHQRPVFTVPNKKCFFIKSEQKIDNE